MKIPIEIITYILDFVDLIDILRFIHATRNNTLYGYFQTRTKATFRKCMSDISKINYSITENESTRSYGNRNITYKLYVTPGKFSHGYLIVHGCKFNVTNLNYSIKEHRFTYGVNSDVYSKYMSYGNATRIYMNVNKALCTFYSSHITLSYDTECSD